MKFLTHLFLKSENLIRRRVFIENIDKPLRTADDDGNLTDDVLRWKSGIEDASPFLP